MNKKTIITVILILLLIAAGASVLFWYWQSQQNSQITSDPMIDVTTDDSSKITLPSLNDPLTNETDSEPRIVPGDSSLIANLYYFVERFGTYSNISDFQNVEDIKSVITDDFYNQVIANRKNLTFEETSTLEYEAYDAKVIKVDWLDNTEIQATAKVTTRRHKITEDSNNPFSQDIVVRLNKVNNQWLISEAVWQ